MSNRRLRERIREMQKQLEDIEQDKAEMQKHNEILKAKLESSIDQRIVTKIVKAGYEEKEGAGSYLEQIQEEYTHRKEKKENKANVAKNLNDTKDHGGKSKLKKSKPVFKNDDFLAYMNRYVQYKLKKKDDEILFLREREQAFGIKTKLIYQELYNVYDEKINGRNYVGRMNDIASIIGGDRQYYWTKGGERYRGTEGNIIDSPNAKQVGLLKMVGDLIK
jgi:hypothetical protein